MLLVVGVMLCWCCGNGGNGGNCFVSSWILDVLCDGKQHVMEQ